MADTPKPDDQPYDWLYGGQRTPGPTPPGRDDTQLQHPASPPPPTDGAGRQQQPSFGGTFPAPVGDRPRFAEPSGLAPPGQPQQPPSVPGGHGSQPARPRRRNWWLRGLLLLVVLWLVFLVAVPLWTWKSIAKVDAEPSGDRPADTPGTTYLLVGSDSRTSDPTGQRTDTIILLHVTSGDGPNLLLSIPRDSYVDIPGHGKSKINAAYAFGGPDLLVQTVEKALDLRVDDYVEVGFSGVVDIVDAVGGITVCPQVSINDPKAGHLKLKKGCQEVDGPTALGYSRSRAFPRGDITRAKHQREVIAAVGKKAASWQTAILPWRYVRVNRAAADTFRVGANVGPIDLVRFGWAMAHSGSSGTKRCVVPYSNLGASTPAGLAVLWDQSKAEALFAALRADDTTAISCNSQ